MKKMFFLAATAALALSSCSSDELVQAPETPAEDGAVTFSAYAGRNTRAAIENLSTVANTGFGVYAYDQGDVAWTTYCASNTQPNFFYNQKVAGVIESYSMPTTITKTQFEALTSTSKGTYYVVNGSNENQFDRQDAGASIDVSTYETLDADLKALCTPVLNSTTPWTYEPVKYYNNNLNAKHSFFAYAPYKHDVKTVFSLGKAPQVRYTMGVDDYDLMWGAHYNDTKATLANVDVTKPGIQNTISFNFKHALTCVSIEAIPFVDIVHSGDTHSSTHNTYGTLAKGTVVTLRSVKFVGTGSTTSLASQGLLNLADGTWTVEGTDEGAYEMTTATEWDASSAALTINEDPCLKKIATNKMLIPASADGSEVKVQVVYDVKTVDPTDPKNNSTITNTITSENTYTLVGGTAYKFHLDLGLTSVKFTATVAEWGEEVGKEVDLPNNHYYTLVAPVSEMKLLAGDVLSGAMAATDFNGRPVNSILIDNDKKAYERKAVGNVASALPTEIEQVKYAYILSNDKSKIYVCDKDGLYTPSPITTSASLSAITNSLGYYNVDNVIYVVK